jgi:hypothetical protein
MDKTQRHVKHTRHLASRKARVHKKQRRTVRYDRAAHAHAHVPVHHD